MVNPEKLDRLSGPGTAKPALLFPYQGSGRNTHFYHFLLGYFLPVFGLTSAQPDLVVKVQESGPLDRWWFEAPVVGAIEVLPITQIKQEIQQRIRNLRPSLNIWLGKLILKLESRSYRDSQMNVKRGARHLLQDTRVREVGVVRLRDFQLGGNGTGPELEKIVAEIKLAMGITRVDGDNSDRRIVIIDRAKLPDFYQNKESGDYGPSRRSIPNLREIASKLESLGAVQVLSPEDMGISQLIEEISKADALVGQHGAGLANMVWMADGKFVIEISHTNAPGEYFTELAALADLNLDRVVCQESAHAPADVEVVFSAVANALSSLSRSETREVLDVPFPGDKGL
jgi:hypothetical protein